MSMAQKIIVGVVIGSLMLLVGIVLDTRATVGNLRGDIRVQARDTENLKRILERVLTGQYTTAQAATEFRRLDGRVGALTERVCGVEKKLDRHIERDGR